MNLSKLQKEIVESKENKIVVMSAAASGKTAVLTERVRFLLRSGVKPETMAVITFTNLAAEEMRSRLAEDFKPGLFIGTIHSLANSFVRAYGIDTSDAIEQEKFERLFELVEENPGCVRHYDWVLLDEAQDSDVDQFSFIFDMINPPNFFVVGDPRQNIYQFNDGDSKYMLTLARQDGVKRISLNENYRNGNEILSFARRLIRPTGIVDDSIAKVSGGKVFEKRLSVDSLITGFKKMSNYGDWAILGRSNDRVNSIIAQLTDAGIPCDGFKQGGLTRQELKEKMEANTVKVLTIHSAKGLEWDNVVVMDTRIGRNEEDRFLAYVAATRAKKKLYWNAEPPQWDRPRKKRNEWAEEWN